MELPILLKTNGIQQYFEPDGEGGTLTLQQLQQAVGGYIEVVCLHCGEDIFNDNLLVVNEEGFLKGLDYNIQASIRAGRPIVGDAIVCSKKHLGQ